MSIRFLSYSIWAGVMPGRLRSWFIGKLPGRPRTRRLRIGCWAIEITRGTQRKA